MWSLPNIIQMNEQKVKEGKERREKEKVCSDCEKKATQSFEYYDIYSDTPMFNDYCDEHFEEFENYQYESYFYCDECGKWYMRNITWENHFVNTEDGEICLNCYTRKIFKNPLGFEAVENLSFETLQKSPHIIGVDNHIMREEIESDGWKDVGTVTADSMTGGLVVSFSNSLGKENTLEAFKEFVKQNGYDEFVIGIDGAYQFAVDITLFAR